MKWIQFYLLLLLCIFYNKGAAQNKPNILWIITDDQRMDSNEIYNQVTRGTSESELGYVSSPNINTLAKEGVFFINTYCNSPACAPSRGSIISGKYPHHSGKYGFERTHNQPDFFSPVLPTLLQEQGYETALFGKPGFRIFQWGPGQTWNSNNFYNLEVDYKNCLQMKGFTDYVKKPVCEKKDGKNNWSKVIGTQHSFLYPDGTSKSFFYEKNKQKLGQEDKENRAFVEQDLNLLYAYTRSQSKLIIGGQSPQPKEKTLDAYILKEYEQYLQNQDHPYPLLGGEEKNGANSTQPQYISLAFHFPHTPVLPPKSYREKFKEKVYHIPDFSQEEVKKLPTQMQTLYQKLKIDGLAPEEKQQAIRDYYAFCTYGDELIGKAVKRFKEYSAKNNQEYMIVYVCGDHGWHLGEQGIEAKFTPWEMSNHCTAIVVSSDKRKYPAGTVYRGFTEFVDIMPTIVAATGANIEEEKYGFMDGEDWAQMLVNKQKRKDYILGEINSIAGPRAYIRTKDFAFSMRTRQKSGAIGKAYQPNEGVEWAMEATLKEIDPALYDLRVDPKERNNVANSKNYAKLTEWFRQKLGNIVLGDGRIECDWSKQNTYTLSEFALGADDKRIEIPRKTIPKVPNK